GLTKPAAWRSDTSVRRINPSNRTRHRRIDARSVADSRQWRCGDVVATMTLNGRNDQKSK
ncbi:MAG: hypothetical protein L0L45_06605, partial [Bifidobacterium mongoliense]|nr:hypothetical protein [Bifidobacterium mongoliense]